MSGSNVALLTPMTNIQRVTLSLTSCPAPPRPQRPGLAARLQSSQVHSLFAALPFECSGRELKNTNYDSNSIETRSEEKVLKPRPQYSESIFTPRSSREIQGLERNRETRPSTDERNIDTDVSMTAGVVSIDKVPNAHTSPTVRPGSLFDLMNFMQSRGDGQTSVRSFTNSAA